MTAQILDGKQLAGQIRQEIAAQVQQWKSAGGATPVLAAVLVGEDPASQVYVRNKEKACKSVGMDSRLIRLPASTTGRHLLDLLDQLNADEGVHGILVQLPLPGSI